jgi:ABC-type transport system substrate-binding protein
MPAQTHSHCVINTLNRLTATHLPNRGLPNEPTMISSHAHNMGRHRAAHLRMGCAAMALALAIAGCSASPTPTPAPQPTSASASAIRIASPSDAIILDPARASSMDDWWATGALLFNQLYSFDAQGRLSPALAKDFPQVSNDGLTLTIPLREGVKFHNGRALIADDVVFTLTRVLLPATASWGATWLMNIAGADEVASGAATQIAGVKSLGPLAVQIQLKQPQAAFPAMLALSAFSIVPRLDRRRRGFHTDPRAIAGHGKLGRDVADEHRRRR